MLLLWIILALSPQLMQEFVTGGDLLANSVYVFLMVLWVVHAIPQSDTSNWKKLVIAVLLGVSLASRLNFVLLLPLVYSALAQRVGWKKAIYYTATSGGVFILLTVPFYLYDPQGFSPTHTANKLGQFSVILPYAGIVIPLANVCLALILALRKDNKLIRNLLQNCTIVLAFPIVIAVILRSIVLGRLDFEYASYGLAYLFFGVVAFYPILSDPKVGFSRSLNKR